MLGKQNLPRHVNAGVVRVGNTASHTHCDRPDNAVRVHEAKRGLQCLHAASLEVLHDRRGKDHAASHKSTIELLLRIGVQGQVEVVEQECTESADNRTGSVLDDPAQFVVDELRDERQAQECFHVGRQDKYQAVRI